ncbi:MAG: glucan biosynthesis protein [Alphaproteobacteria bacterium]|nr:glucan biosynthesis protein [Alphaproteobacteria bacterium]MBU1514842.1 glucan biosynthesis protein [Alphaproteobacteria bacterium]MBU2093763.1 glucan biosynthesis protein [Alphaproteobacteria bacterium]MBU2149384.1 glucan biosynthesis protein [Alphaproteobacteria bacterium]MBU2305344.1 glucan biosynthesis protein [Alphaproteobacteria bacterium]
MALAPATLLAAGWAPSDAIGEMVRRRARDLGRARYRPVDRPLQASLANMGYDAYRDLRFRPDQAIWRAEGLPFQLQMFHRGGLFRDPVDLFEADHGRVRPIKFSESLFTYGQQTPGPLPADLGFAGFRVHAPMDVPGRFDEVVAFLGASYFRAVAKGISYGLSARGLALGAGEPGEEFPAFRAFWVERPAPGARSLVIHALLDSVSTAGAFRFEVTPGTLTVMEVEARLFPRRPLASAGIAPLTSMYLFGPEQPRRYDDFRPEVHDSDGLLTDDGHGGRIWRPLVHTPATRVRDVDPGPARGFGLLQRQRAFEAYQDLEADYHRRPGAWVEPLEGFGQGSVRLVELGARSEAEDNIVAMWRPAAPLAAGREHRFRYRLTWGASPEPRTRLAQAVAWRAGSSHDPRRRRFLVDFAPLPPGGLHGVEAQASATGGSIRVETVQPNASIGGARVSFELDPGTAATSDLRLTLVRGRTPVSEVWMYRWLA